MLNPPRLYTLYSSFRGSDPSYGQELYDLLADPYQLHNVALDAARASELQQFENALEAFRICSGASCIDLGQAFVVNPVTQTRRPKVSPTP